MRLWLTPPMGHGPRPKTVYTTTYRGRRNGAAAVRRLFHAYGGARLRGVPLKVHRVGGRAMLRYSVWDGLVGALTPPRRQKFNEKYEVVPSEWLAYIWSDLFWVCDPKRNPGVRIVRV